MARLRVIPWRLWLYATAVVVMGLQVIGWHRVTDTATAAARTVGRTIEPALTVGWPLLVAVAIGTVAPRWLPAIGGRIRGNSRRPSENWLPGLAVTACLAIGLLLACVLVFPQLLYPPLTEHQLNTVAEGNRVAAARDQAKLQNDARTTLLQGLGGTAVLIGVYFTFRQLRIARQGQVTDRFTRAVDQLGHDSPDVQLGGIYALQQISRDSDQERTAIHEILAAYVRIHAPWPGPHDPGPVKVEDLPRLREWAPGAQAAMLALGRRTTSTGAPLDLMGTNLQRLRLSDTYIPRGANLARVLFWRSCMINASLGHANLREAKLGWTDLRHSWLSDADLREADLRRADLRYTTLRDADLRGADLRGADLRDTIKLETAKLEGARVGTTGRDATKWPDRFPWQSAGVVVDP
jgi:Pentapeptide repeats (8 copies)